MKFIKFDQLTKLLVTITMLLTCFTSFASDAHKEETQLRQKDFDFLIGNWNCEWQRLDDKGNIQSKTACKWDAKYAFNGLMVQDDFRMMNPAGQLVFAGTTLRSYSPKEKQWKNTFLAVMGGPAFEDFVGKKVGDEIHLQTTRKSLDGKKTYMKIRFHNISNDGFSWEGETSVDGKSWALESRIISKKS